MKEQLKPCPFCGGKPEKRYYPETGNGNINGFIACIECEMKTRPFSLLARGWKDAAAFWNKREILT